jgi:aspartate/methionine/tyrosine aminotransferase
MADSERSPRAGLSKRGQQLVEASPTPEYLRAHFERNELLYDAVARPDGYIPLCVAENALVFDVLRAKMDQCRDVTAPWLGYQSMTGAPRFKEQLARFMSRKILGREVRPEHVAALAGAGSVLEILFHAIADAGDAVLVPTPSYAGFWLDLETRDEISILPVHTTSGEGFRLTTARLEQAMAASTRPVRALLFTSPNNPLGTVYAPSELEEILRFGERAGLHVVFDEIYALSVFGATPFRSVASLRPSLGPNVHIVWAFSKDFAASGLRCGALVTENLDLLAAVDALAYWACVSGDTQFLLGEMVSDDLWVDHYASTMQARLGEAYRAITARLEAAGIPYVPSEAGFFFLLDLRARLDAPTWAAEDALWRRLLEQANVNLTPGSACRIGEPGFMRLCFAGVPPATAAVGVDRLARALRPRA